MNLQTCIRLYGGLVLYNPNIPKGEIFADFVVLGVTSENVILEIFT